MSLSNITDSTPRKPARSFERKPRSTRRPEEQRPLLPADARVARQKRRAGRTSQHDVCVVAPARRPVPLAPRHLPEPEEIGDDKFAWDRPVNVGKQTWQLMSQRVAGALACKVDCPASGMGFACSKEQAVAVYGQINNGIHLLCGIGMDVDAACREVALNHALWKALAKLSPDMLKMHEVSVGSGRTRVRFVEEPTIEVMGPIVSSLMRSGQGRSALALLNVCGASVRSALVADALALLDRLGDDEVARGELISMALQAGKRVLERGDSDAFIELLNACPPEKLAPMASLLLEAEGGVSLSDPSQIAQALFDRFAGVRLNKANIAREMLKPQAAILLAGSLPTKSALKVLEQVVNLINVLDSYQFTRRASVSLRDQAEELMEVLQGRSSVEPADDENGLDLPPALPPASRDVAQEKTLAVLEASLLEDLREGNPVGAAGKLARLKESGGSRERVCSFSPMLIDALQEQLEAAGCTLKLGVRVHGTENPIDFAGPLEAFPLTLFVHLAEVMMYDQGLLDHVRAFVLAASKKLLADQRKECMREATPANLEILARVAVTLAGRMRKCGQLPEALEVLDACGIACIRLDKAAPRNDMLDERIEHAVSWILVDAVANARVRYHGELQRCLAALGQVGTDIDATLKRNLLEACWLFDACAWLEDLQTKDPGLAQHLASECLRRLPRSERLSTFGPQTGEASICDLARPARAALRKIAMHAKRPPMTDAEFIEKLGCLVLPSTNFLCLFPDSVVATFAGGIFEPVDVRFALNVHAFRNPESGGVVRTHAADKLTGCAQEGWFPPPSWSAENCVEFLQIALPKGDLETQIERYLRAKTASAEQRARLGEVTRLLAIQWCKDAVDDDATKRTLMLGNVVCLVRETLDLADHDLRKAQVKQQKAFFDLLVSLLESTGLTVEDLKARSHVNTSWDAKFLDPALEIVGLAREIETGVKGLLGALDSIGAFAEEHFNPLSSLAVRSLLVRAMTKEHGRGDGNQRGARCKIATFYTQLYRWYGQLRIDPEHSFALGDLLVEAGNELVHQKASVTLCAAWVGGLASSALPLSHVKNCQSAVAAMLRRMEGVEVNQFCKLLLQRYVIDPRARVKLTTLLGELLQKLVKDRAWRKDPQALPRIRELFVLLWSPEISEALQHHGFNDGRNYVGAHKKTMKLLDLEFQKALQEDREPRRIPSTVD